MSNTLEKLEHNMVKISMEIPTEDFDKACDRACLLYTSFFLGRRLILRHKAHHLFIGTRLDDLI